MDHPQHCQHLAEQIATETDEAKRERLRERFRDECRDGVLDAGDDDAIVQPLSGGGGTTNPTQPGPKPKLP
ncbi:hypothetical protein [Sphingomonas parapaucimobilis]|uniref:Uncharacterized protein n=1 Tax=Sphingomonas parapaucimobilis NBRC 15100 TaxID=1219049 RepID=A0A0A1W8S1_9SPHN|nr:hypothetical protein [Sphingomonas parapaucimobilis]GAM01733.1 hypothetical protein SP5_068_01010 [Sphingomonas parapaucimobilis NBRC 15100]